MRREILATPFLLIAVFVILATNVHANNNSVAGLLIGGGTGAIVGQAIGGNPESTIAGAMIGGGVGVIIGSNIERNHGGRGHYRRPVFSHSNRRYIPRGQYVYKAKRHHYAHHRPAKRHAYGKHKRKHKAKRVFSKPYRDDRRHHFKQKRRNW